MMIGMYKVRFERILKRGSYLGLVCAIATLIFVAREAHAVDLFQKALIQQTQIVDQVNQAIRREKALGGKPLPETPTSASVAEPETSKVGLAREERPVEIPPVSLSRSLKAQTDDQRIATASALKAEIDALQSRLDANLLVDPKTPDLITEITQINETLSAKKEAYDFTLGVSNNLSNAAAESFAALNNPYFLVCGHALWAPKDPLDWLAKLTPVKDKLIQAGRSVGLIKIGERPAGTAFVVRKGFVLTNTHVLRLIADYDKAKKTWRINPLATVTFDAEYTLGPNGNCTTPNPPKTFSINGVYAVPGEALTTASDGSTKTDIAILLVSVNPSFPQELDVIVVPPNKYAGNMVLAVIGYPGPPDDMTVAERMEFFAPPDAIVPVFPYKRLSSGFVGEQQVDSEGLFTHRANTSGGNSGSPIFDLADGSVVGIHVKGRDRFKNVMGLNYGLTSERIRAFLGKSGISITK
jgi:S1-C subfamily serine protease